MLRIHANSLEKEAKNWDWNLKTVASFSWLSLKHLMIKTEFINVAFDGNNSIKHFIRPPARKL